MGRSDGHGEGGRKEEMAREERRGGRRTKETRKERSDGKRQASLCLWLAGRPSRTKTQVHIQGDVGRWPGVTSIKDGLTSTDRPTAGTTTRPIPFLASYASLDNHRAGVSPSRERSFVHFLLPPPSSFPSFSFDREETETRDPRLRNWIYICGRRKKIYFPPCGRINFYSFRTVW